MDIYVYSCYGYLFVTIPLLNDMASQVGAMAPILSESIRLLDAVFTTHRPSNPSYRNPDSPTGLKRIHLEAIGISGISCKGLGPSGLTTDCFIVES